MVCRVGDDGHGYDIVCVNGFIHSRRALFFCRLVLEPHSTHARHFHTSLVPWWCSLSASGPPLGGYIGHQPGAQDGAGCNNRCLEKLSTQHSAGAKPPKFCGWGIQATTKNFNLSWMCGWIHELDPFGFYSLTHSIRGVEWGKTLAH